MNHRPSDQSLEVHSYHTPEGSPASTPLASARTSLEQRAGQTTAADPRYESSHTSSNPRSEAPPYTENADPSSHHSNHEVRNSGESHQESISDFRDAPSRHGDSASVTASTNSKRRIADSIKSYFRRNSHSSSRKDIEATAGENENNEKEEKEETPEELVKRMEDPQHLLNTILEEPEDFNQDLLMPVGDAAAVVAGDSTFIDEKNEQAKLIERRKGYRENLMRNRKLRKHTKASRTIHTLRRVIKSFMNYSLLTRTFIYWIPLAIILFIPLGIGAWNDPNIELGHTRLMWIFIWLEVVWGSLWISHIFSHYLPIIFGYLMSIFSPKYFKYVNMVSALRFAIQLVLWTFITFISFSPILNDNKNALDDKVKKQPHWQKIVQDVCVALLVSSIVFFVEQTFLYLLSTSFHRTRMALRIQKQKRSVNILIILLDAAFQFFPWHCDEFDEEDSGLQFVAFNKARKSGSKSKNAVVRKVNNIVGTATKNVENVIASTKVENTNPTPAKIVNKALASRDTREVLANRIWKSLVMEDSTFLTYEDLISVFGMERKEEVLFMFDVLDRDGMNGIELDEMVESVHMIGRENKQIQRSLVDMDGAINKLHYLLMCIALVLIVVIFVGMLAPSSATVLATLGSTLLSMSFLFSATAQEVFQSCIFLFVKHPFDIGDWIQTYVAGIGLVRMRVVGLNLLYSVFEELGVNTRRQVSNSALSTVFIDNISRSPPSQVSTVLNVGIPETTTEQLAEFETRMNEFVEANPREYIPGVYFQATSQPDLDRLALTISVNTRNNQDDIVLFSSRRTKVYEFISQCINEIPIAIPQREDVSNHDPSLPMFHYKIKSLDEAMSFAAKSKGRRQVYGLRPPLEGDELSVASNEEAIDTSGYADGPVPQPMHSNSVIPVDNSSQARVSVRRTSFSSRMSRHSRAYSSASKASQTFGLRSRKQVAHPPPPPNLHEAADDQGN